MSHNTPVKKKIYYQDVVIHNSKPTERQLECIAALRKRIEEHGGNSEIIREPTTNKEAQYAIASLRRLETKYYRQRKENHAKEVSETG